MTLSDRIVVMNQGIIEQIGTPVEIYRFPNSRFVADFIGRANFVLAKVREKRGRDISVNALGGIIELSDVRGEFNKGTGHTHRTT